MNSTMQQGPLEASLSDQLGPLPEQAGWCVLMHGHAAAFASNAERAVGLSCGATTQLFTADQMRAYAAQEVAAERERCAKLLRAVGVGLNELSEGGA